MVCRFFLSDDSFSVSPVPPALIQKANLLYRLGKFSDALESCQAALERGADAETSGADKFVLNLRQKLQSK
jgi:hypothetical protein